MVRLQGAKSGGHEESAQAKNKALADAGAIVPTSFEGLESTVKATYISLVFAQNLDYICYSRLNLSTQEVLEWTRDLSDS